MYKVLKFIYKNILPIQLRNRFDLFPSLRGKMNYAEVIEKPAGSRVLVLSPHPDDDIFGCGGTLHKHHLAGDNIVSVYMTDGRKGNPDFGSEEKLVLKRREEAGRAAKIVGINRLIFLENRDSELSVNNKTVRQLTDLIKEIKPDIVYLPFLLDYHPDHIATNGIFTSVIKKNPFKLTCYAYEIWTPMVPNRVVDIGDYEHVKKTALEQFKIEPRNIVGASFGLSKYRSVLHTGRDSCVECFFYCNADEYLKLWNLIEW